MSLKINILEFFKSPEGKKAVEEFWKQKDNRETILNYQLEKFHNLYKDKLDDVIEHIRNKYESKEYRLKEYRLGREPMESLYWFLFDYAEKYSIECHEKEYYNDFTGKIYYLGSYVIQTIYGQGGAIIINKKINK